MFVSALVAVILVALFATKPSREDFDREVAFMLREAISNTTPDNTKDLVSNLAVIGCRVRAEDCLTVLKRTFSVSTADYIILTRNIVDGPGTKIRCWGLLKQFVCDAGVSVPTLKQALNVLW
jgi:hypothetical protein